MQQDGEKFILSGRGELHLSILIETLRREGYEFQVGKPEVIIKTINNYKLIVIFISPPFVFVKNYFYLTLDTT